MVAFLLKAGFPSLFKQFNDLSRIPGEVRGRGLVWIGYFYIIELKGADEW
jgi:hypothetical protein